MLTIPYTHNLFRLINVYDYSTEFYRLYYGLQKQLYHNNELTLKTDIVKLIENVDFDKVFAPGRVELISTDEHPIVAVLANFPCQTLERAKFTTTPKIKIDYIDQIHTGLYARFEGFTRKENNNVNCELSVICPTCLTCLKIFDIEIETTCKNTSKTKELVKRLNDDFGNYEILFVNYKRNKDDNIIRYFVRNVLVHVDLITDNEPRGYPQNVDLIEFVKHEIYNQMAKY